MTTLLISSIAVLNMFCLYFVKCYDYIIKWCTGVACEGVNMAGYCLSFKSIIAGVIQPLGVFFHVGGNMISSLFYTQGYFYHVGFRWYYEILTCIIY